MGACLMGCACATTQPVHVGAADPSGDSAMLVNLPTSPKKATKVAALPAPPADREKKLSWSPDALAHRGTPANPKEVARARRFLEKGLGLYRRGDYDKAEDQLKQAMTVYPFLAEANLTLGKIFLIRGSATMDRVLLKNARLMFEMARRLDPTLRETALLLDLCTTPANL